MPYLYSRYLKDGTGACRNCRVKRWESDGLTPSKIMPEEEPGPEREPEAPPAPLESPETPEVSPLPQRLPWEQMRELTETLRSDESEKDLVSRTVRDQEYFRNIYPLRIRRMKDYIREEADRWESNSGWMCDEYPDRVRMDQVRDRILQRMKEDSVKEVITHEDYSRDVLEALLYQEIMERRNRCRP